MSTDETAPPSSSPLKEQLETVTPMDTTATDVEPVTVEEAPTDTVEEPSTETKAGKRKRPAKSPVETEEANLSSARPRRTLTKREEPPVVPVNGAGRVSKTKAQRNSVEQAAGDADDEQERDKNIPIVHDVADVVWVKMGGHPWWPSLIIRDPNDGTRSFTKVSGNARAKRMYFVVFYGSTADFAWVSDAAIIPYQGVEAFTKYAQEVVDKATSKCQKEQLTERFQLKVTIGRREDWEQAVREADDSLKQTSETRLEEIEPKVQFYTTKLSASKGQSGRKSKVSVSKPEESSEPASASASSVDPNDRLTIVEKAFDFKSDDEDEEEDVDDDDDDESSVDESPVRKTSSMKIKLKKQASNEDDSTPPAKRRYVRKSNNPSGGSVSHGKATNGSSAVNGDSPGRKRGRPRLSKPAVISSNGEKPTPKKSITKPQAFMNKSQPVSSLKTILASQHHQFDTRIGFLSPFEEQEIFDIIDQSRSTRTFEEVEQLAKRRFEHILCLNLNKTEVDIPPEWFYSFLFAHPVLIVKNSQWFNEKKSADSLTDTDFLNDSNRIQSSSGVQVLKHQLGILSKLYRNELQVRLGEVNSVAREDNLHSV